VDPGRDLNQLLLSFYPEFRDRSFNVVLQPHGAQFEIIVTDASGRKTPEEVVAAPRLLQGSVTLNRDNRVLAFVASGPFLRSADNESLAKAMRAAVSEKRQPDDEVTQARPQFGLGKGAVLLASITQSLDVRFRSFAVLSLESVVTTESDYPFRWVLKIASTTPEGRTEKHTMTFEPFEGRLIALTTER
jgi:hypothetical protein